MVAAKKCKPVDLTQPPKWATYFDDVHSAIAYAEACVVEQARRNDQYRVFAIRQKETGLREIEDSAMMTVSEKYKVANQP